ncbi:hypothetical protein DHW03_18850 [Pedobacter yonginense]|uniref:Plasmid transfer protein n=1 Tax=Pedobacter yonginense TaxID=651869 RepID=A0A317EH36_9SPHI|nr:hypothetical protein [Pedobacter yonginense]PWS25894.1 hypothetical protein DHW03_18850 [Pedobacter yonginense]
MKRLLFLSAFFLSAVSSYAQLNVPLMHQLIENSKTEHGKQIDAKNQQAKNTAVEATNKTLMTSVKDRYRTLQERFAKMSIVFDAVNIGISATPLVREIIKEQQKIVVYAQSDPLLIPIALDSEVIFVQKANSLVNYLIGLCAVIGDVNQMKVSDRRILFEHILNELRNISYLSGGVARTLQASVMKKRGTDPFSDYINREETLVNDIMNNVKILKQ